MTSTIAMVDAVNSGAGERWRASRRVLDKVRRDLFVPSPGGFPALDGIRAIAVLSVILFHCAVFSNYVSSNMKAREVSLSLAQQILLNLWSGVDIFFVLSGFLIGRILLRRLLSDGRLFYASFLVRRSLRIFPLYYLVLTASLFWIAPNAPGLFSGLWNTVSLRREMFRAFEPQAQVQGAIPIFEGQWAAANQELLLSTAWTHYAYLSNYLLGSDAPKVMSWAWSLCVEEHFYLLLPPLLWLTVRERRPVWHAVGLGLGLAVPFAFRLAAYLGDSGVSVGAIYAKSHNRMDELFVGLVIAYFYVHHQAALVRGAQRVGALLPLTGALAIGAVWIYGDPELSGAFPVLFQFPLLAWGTACFVVHGVSCQGIAVRLLSLRALYPVARVSYGMYLVHPLVMLSLLAGPFRPILSLEEKGWLLLVLYVTTAVLSWLIAAVLFVIFERPLLDLGARLSDRLTSRARDTHPL
jgi:peptidoglycan/LPS O-acetylase OafA/YrhL